jgi:hypothetical protein
MKLIKRGMHKMSEVRITMKYDVTKEQLSSLLTSAFEGGSNYWCELNRKITPSKWEFVTEPKASKHYLEDYPLNPGGALLLTDKLEEESSPYRLDWEQLQKGLQIMADKYPESFLLIINENDDANTGDCFLQCCIFGEEIYG